MRQRGQTVARDEVTDAELACRAGAGDLPAFEELYRRHVEAAWRVALAVTANPDDAADAVSDAFTRVLQALPERLQAADYFLPYLLASVRNAAIDVLRRGGRQRPTDLGDADDLSLLGPEPAELLVAGTDAALIARAFRSLPERWRSVLWLTEVEGIPAREVAGLLGVSANGVAQLAVRARAGLRQRFLQAHLRETEVRNLCRYTVDRLGAYAAGALPPRDISKVDQHLAGCETCRSRLAQLEDLAPSLRRAVLPLPAGLAALSLGKWRLASTGATGAAGTTGASTVTMATAAAPAGIGVGAAAVVAPAPFIASFASVALLVAGIVGVGVVEHHRLAPSAPSAKVAPAPDISYGTAAAPADELHLRLVADAPIAGLVNESTRPIGELSAFAENVAVTLPAGLPELAAPDPADLQGIGSGVVRIDVKAVAVAVDLADGAAACPSVRVLGPHLSCHLLAGETPDSPAVNDIGAADAAEGAATEAKAVIEATADGAVNPPMEVGQGVGAVLRSSFTAIGIGD